jgi:hypothetical protein
MEYTVPVLRIVGTAQALVLGSNMSGPDDGSSGTQTKPTVALIGLDD